MVALRGIAWVVLAAGYLASLTGALFLRPYRRWTAERELVVVQGMFPDGVVVPVSFAGWTIDSAGPDELVVRRGWSETRIPWITAHAAAQR